jgi:aspartate ammonia-lyase
VASERSIRDIVLERGLMAPDDLDRILGAEAMTRPGIAGNQAGTAKQQP